MRYELKAAKLAREEFDELLKKANNFLDSFSECNKAVIYGAGEYGTFFKRIMDDQKIPVTWYWDMRAEELREADGIPVVLPFEEPGERPEWVFACLYNEAARTDVLRRLSERGYSHIVDCYTDNMHVYLRLLACEWSGISPGGDCFACEFVNDCPKRRLSLLEHLKEVDEVHRRGYSDYPMLDHCNRLATGITWECNLRCKGCLYTMPHIRFEKKGARDPEEYLAEIKKFLAVTEYLRYLSIGDGETLIYQDTLMTVLKALVKEFRIFSIVIISNATIPIKVDLLKFIKEHREKIWFLLDDYEAPKADVAGFANILKENGIKYHILPKENNTWYDMRTTGNRPISDEELPDILQSCKYWQLHGFPLEGGYLYPRCCGQHEVAEITGALDSAVRVDLMNTPVEQLAQKLTAIHNETTQMEACRACPFIDDSVIIPAGEQMTPEEFKQMRDEYYAKKEAQQKS